MATREATRKAKAEVGRRVLASNLAAAEQGDSYGQHRMGQRYRDERVLKETWRRLASG